MTELHKNYIAGEWVAGVGVSRNINPSNTNDVIGEFAQADAAQVDAAVAAARAAFPAWAHTTPLARHDILLKVSLEIAARKEELGRLLAREEGKTLPEAIGEVLRAAQIFEFFAGEALRIPGEKFASVRPGVEVEVTREPVGVVGVISPWNFPIAIPAWKIAPALCYGNYSGVQARRLGSRLGACARRNSRSRRDSQRGLQSDDGAWLGGRRSDARS